MARKVTVRKKKNAPLPKRGALPPEGAAKDPLSLASEVYREVGGFERFVEWASDEKNIGVFYKDIFLKMLAREVDASAERDETIVVRIENKAKE